jgi:hypothetical protein
MADYVDLTGPNGTEDNIGGIATTMYYAPISNFNVIQDTAETLSSFVPGTDDYEDLAEITASHTFLSGHGFNTLYNTANTGMVEFPQQGERDGYSMKIVLKFFYPGMDSVLLGFLRRVKNDRLLVLARMMDNSVLQIGSKLAPAYMRIESGGTSNQEGGRRGFNVIVECPVTSGPIKYTGTITLQP